MTRNVALVAVLVAALAAPELAFSQNRGPRGGSSSGGSSSGGSSGGGAAPRSGGSVSSGGGSAGRTGGGTSSWSTSRPRAVPRGGSASGGSVQSGRSDSGAQARERNTQPNRGRAVPRQPGSGGSGGGSTIIVPSPGYWGGYYPWGYAGLGFGGYYGGLYDPWWYGGGYGGGYYAGDYGYLGSLRLKMRPRDASVYVDGYYAGVVDSYDGVFQRLKLEAGPHRVEVRADGFEPLMFEVNILSDRTVTYEGELKALP